MVPLLASIVPFGDRQIAPKKFFWAPSFTFLPKKRGTQKWWFWGGGGKKFILKTYFAFLSAQRNNATETWRQGQERVEIFENWTGVGGTLVAFRISAAYRPQTCDPDCLVQGPNSWISPKIDKESLFWSFQARARESQKSLALE